MGDISELRGLVTIVSFLGLLVLLMSYIPQAMYTMGDEHSVDVPDQWQGIDIQSFVDTWNSTSLANNLTDFDIGGRNLRWDSVEASDYMILYHRYGFLLLFIEAGDWYNRAGVKVSQETSLIPPLIRPEHINGDDLDNDYSTYEDIRFTIRFDSEAIFQVTALFDFNETTYNNPSDAWNNNELNVLIGIGFDDVNTSYNIWDLISMLLFFRMPNVSPILMGIIAIPIWVAIIYLAYVLAIKVIPLIAGG